MLTTDDRNQPNPPPVEKLATGGRIPMPLAVQPWGSYSSKLTDKFGVQWKLNCAG